VKVLYLGRPSDTFGCIALERLRAELDLELFDWSAPLAPQFDGVDIVVDMGGGYSTAEMLEAGGSVRLWQVFGNGVDHFDVELWRSKGAVAVNSPGPAHAVALAEHAVMGLLMLVKQYPVARRNLLSELQGHPLGRELAGLRLLTVGFGAAAREFAIRASALGLEVSAVDVAPAPPAEAARWGVGRIHHVDHLESELSRTDVVSLHLPLDATTRNILDRRRLALMPPGAYLVNVSRGGLIDQRALTDALRSGRLAGAVLDVFEHEPLPWSSPLMWMPNVIATPHIAGVTAETAVRRAVAVLENIKRVANGDEPLHRVC